MAELQVRSLARRLAAIEKALLARKQPSLGFSSIDGGALQANDDDGDLTLIMGTQFDGTNTTAVVKGPVPPNPIAPYVTEQGGSIRVYWDGTFVNGAVAPMDFARVLVYAEPLITYDGPEPLNQALIIGQFTSATGGEITALLNMGIEYAIYLVTWTQAGKYSSGSDVALITPGPPGIAEQDSSVAGVIGASQSIILKQTPLLNSEHVYWNGQYQPGSEWNRIGNVIVIPDPDVDAEIEDEFVCEYLYAPVVESAGPITVVGSAFTDLDVSSHPGTNFDIALPTGTEEGDLLCLVVSSWVDPSVCSDPRFFMSQLRTDDDVPGGNLDRLTLVAIGFADATSDPIPITVGSTGWRGAAIVAFRGAHITSALQSFSIGTPGTFTLPSPASRYIAVVGTIAGTVGDTITLPSDPAGAWTQVLRDRVNKAGAFIAYTPNASQALEDLGSVTFGPGLGGGTGFDNVIILGVR